MSLLDRVETDLVAAIKNKDETKRDVLRLVKSALKNAAIEKGSELEEQEVINVLGREVKKRKESIAAYEQAGRAELVASEQGEIEILQAYLPAQMSEEEIRQIVTTYLQSNPTTVTETGRAMGALSAQLKGQADLGLVAKILRESL